MMTLLLANPQSPEWGKAAPIGLFVLLAFVVACFFLFRSMVKHIRKVPPTFDSKANVREAARIGAAPPRVPTVDYVDPKSQTPPRLGAPSDRPAQQPTVTGTSRKEQIRQAKERRAQRNDKSSD